MTDLPIRELQETFRGSITVEDAHLGRFDSDASHLNGRASGAMSPVDSQDVVELVRWARRHRVPLVTRGGGSSLDGESVPSPGSVVIDLSGWNSVLEVDPVDRIARVGPGLVNRELQRSVRAYGLFFPPNPGSWMVSTIGGNAATNASGPRSFRYGSTRAWIRGIEVVLGTGERVHLGSRVRKRSVGPDLVGAFVGSEGTLGVFTELTVGLAPLPECRMGVVVPLPGRSSLAPVLEAVPRAGALGVSAAEYLDGRCAQELAQLSSGRLSGGGPLMLLELETTREQESSGLERLFDWLRSLGIRDDPSVYPDVDELWTLRGRSGEALDRSVGPRIREDVAVPVSRLPDLLDLIERLAISHGTQVWVYGHLGEASLHPNFALAPGSVEGERLRGELLRACRALGGTISAEHGVGLLKNSYLAEELGAGAVRILGALKLACDPDSILNPGKLYPPGSGGGQSPSTSPPESGDGRAGSR